MVSFLRLEMRSPTLAKEARYSHHYIDSSRYIPSSQTSNPFLFAFAWAVLPQSVHGDGPFRWKSIVGIHALVCNLGESVAEIIKERRPRLLR
jgi:hypothetical protein